MKKDISSSFSSPSSFCRKCLLSVVSLFFLAFFSLSLLVFLNVWWYLISYWYLCMKNSIVVIWSSWRGLPPPSVVPFSDNTAACYNMFTCPVGSLRSGRRSCCFVCLFLMPCPVPQCIFLWVLVGASDRLYLWQEHKKLERWEKTLFRNHQLFRRGACCLLSPGTLLWLGGGGQWQDDLEGQRSPWWSQKSYSIWFVK